jgi:plasmid stabilization system protein ParE
MIVREKAASDLAQARDYYEEQREGLGDEFLHSVNLVFDRIESMPEVPAFVHRDIRRALVRRFPFAVYYRIVDDEVVIIAVIHSHRDPKRWLSRG